MDAEVKRDDPTQTTGKPDRSAPRTEAGRALLDFIRSMSAEAAAWHGYPERIALIEEQAATEALDKYAETTGTVQRAFALIRDLRAQGLPKEAGEADRLIIVAIAGAATEARRDLDVDVLARALYRVEADPDFISLPRWDLYFGTVAKRIAAEYRRLIEERS